MSPRLTFHYHVTWVFLNSDKSEDRTEKVFADIGLVHAHVLELLFDMRTKSVTVDVVEYIP